MRPIKLIEEAQRQQWAMTHGSLRAMLSVLDGDDLRAEDHALFHSADQEIKQVNNSFGGAVDGALYSSVKGDTGYLMIDGPIIPRATWFSKASGMVSLDVLESEFKSMEQSQQIKNIVLLVDSPGGAVTGVSDFANLVKRSEKTTYAFAWMAASAAYWIASAVDHFVAPDTGMVGSIGTVVSLTDTTEADNKRGVKHIDIVSAQSPNKRPDPATAEGRAVVQQLVNDLSDVFISTVADNRGVTVDQVLQEFGGGAMLVAGKGVAAGMLDRVMTMQDFLKQFKTSAMWPGATKENNMSDNKLTAAELRDQHPEAVSEIEAAAATKERERLQAIEGVAAKVDQALPAVKAEAIKHINAEKYKAGSTPESVLAGMVEIVAKAQVGAVDTFAGERRDQAKVAAVVGGEAPTDEEHEAEQSEARVNALIKARKQRKQ